MERTEIQLHDDWKVVKIDSMNWQVCQLREIKENNNPKAKRAGEVDWVAMPNYFGTVQDAAGFVHDHLADKAGRKNLEEFTAFMAKERKKVVDAVRKRDGSNGSR